MSLTYVTDENIIRLQQTIFHSINDHFVNLASLRRYCPLLALVIARALNTTRSSECWGREPLEQRMSVASSRSSPSTPCNVAPHNVVLKLVLDTHDEKLYVLKRIHCATVDEANEALSEARTLSRFKSPYVVELSDFFLEHKQFNRNDRKLYVCIVMEYMEGGDLAVQIEQRAQSGLGPFPEKTVLCWFLQALRALHHVHCKGLIHRDIKPENLLLTTKDTVRVCSSSLTKAIYSLPCFDKTNQLLSEVRSSKSGTLGSPNF